MSVQNIDTAITKDIKQYNATEDQIISAQWGFLNWCYTEMEILIHATSEWEKYF
jgi:hypothetical protein